jgi:hypothetical protein
MYTEEVSMDRSSRIAGSILKKTLSFSSARTIKTFPVVAMRVNDPN